MPHRLARLTTALSNTSNDALAAWEVRQGLMNALQDWPGSTDRCCALIPFGQKLTRNIRCFALSMLEQLNNYFPSATRPYHQDHLEGFWTMAEAAAE